MITGEIAIKHRKDSVGLVGNCTAKIENMVIRATEYSN